jgi:hypothetical protein
MITNAIATVPTEQRIDPVTVPGWGVDADPRNDPTYPLRDREKDDHSGNWARPTQQQTSTEVLSSIEHIRRPAVVGTSAPPSGFSGVIRRLAFQWSESNLIHWMLLLAADRLNVVEGVLDDARHGKVPDIPAEMGGHAELKHREHGLVAKLAIGATVVGVAAFLFPRPRQRP